MSCQPQTYQRPPRPSDQLKVVFDYFDKLKVWDFDGIAKLSTPGFTQQTLPASLDIAERTKEEDIAFLHTFRDSLQGAHLDIDIYDINETVGKVWVHLFMKTVKTEAFFNFKFGTGRDKNLVINLTEFVDSKVYAGGSGSDSNSTNGST